jgi:hypothetical protein
MVLLGLEVKCSVKVSISSLGRCWQYGSSWRRWGGGELYENLQQTQARCDQNDFSIFPALLEERRILIPFIFRVLQALWVNKALRVSKANG